MEHTDRDEVRDKSQSWISRPAISPGRDRGPFPRFGPTLGSTHWLLNLAILVAFCAALTAVCAELLRAWRPGVFIQGSPLSGLSPLPAVHPRPADAQASALAPGRSPMALNLELEAQARQRALEETSRRRAAAVKQTEADEAAVRRRNEFEARREREWRASYVKPTQCDEAVPTVDSVGCANDYIRARRKFDEQFLATNRR